MMNVTDIVIRMKRRRGEYAQHQILLSTKGSLDANLTEYFGHLMSENKDKAENESIDQSSERLIFKRVRSSDQSSQIDSRRASGGNLVTPNLSTQNLKSQSECATPVLVELGRSKAQQLRSEHSSQSIARNFHLIDIVPAQNEAQLLPDQFSFTEADYSSFQNLNSSSKRAARIMSPMERRMDEAIWNAFKTRNAKPLLDAIQVGASVNFNRSHADGTTPLMAAAYCNDDSVVDSLLALNANPSIVDFSGNTASKIASMYGHTHMSNKLYAAQIKRDEIRSGHSTDFVYDFYTFDLSPNRLGINGNSKLPILHVDGISDINVDVKSEMSVDSAMYAFDTAIEPIEFSILNEYEEITSEVDSCDEDSNAEDFYKNSYPDERDCNWSDGDDYNSNESYESNTQHESEY